jgi:quinohemoprotein ethanol dehydrogenase
MHRLQGRTDRTGRKPIVLLLLCTAVLAGCSGKAPEAGWVDADRLAAADAEPGQWFTSGRDGDGTYFSPLTKISDANVGQLGFAWDYKLGTKRGLQSTPIVVDGIMVFSGNWGKVYALDAATGKELWTFDPQVDGQIGRHACCDVVSRGLSVWHGKVYTVALDGKLSALDLKTGKPVWQANTITDKSFPYTVTGAPQIAGKVVVVGSSGADFGARGYVAGYDLETGKEKWRSFVVPRNPALGPQESPEMQAALASWSPGTDWKDGGGGTVWDGMAYDPEHNLLYVGTGNGSGYNARTRSPGGGDNKYLASILALDADSGRLKWAFQTVPGEHWDYTATQKFILADLKIDGVDRKVIMQAPKNGFFYVLDRVTGEFLSAKNYVYQNWAKGLDPKTGRPIPNPAVADYTGDARLVYPGMQGGHNWQPMAYSPKTGLVYIPAMEAGMVFVDAAQRPIGRIQGTFDVHGIFVEGYAPAAMKTWYGDLPSLEALLQKAGRSKASPSFSVLRAWDPVRQKLVWEQLMPSFWDGGVSATAGNLVFHGTSSGHLAAYAADTGKLLHKVDVGTSIMAAPMTYEIGGVQYVAVLAGFGGAGGAGFAPSTAAYKYGNEGRVVVFKLGGGAVPKPAPFVDRPYPDAIPQFGTPQQIAAGGLTFARTCGGCHGAPRGLYPDLTRSPLIADAAAFRAVVLEGALVPNGMARFDDVLKPEDAEAIRAYLVSLPRQSDVTAEAKPATGK